MHSLTLTPINRCGKRWPIFVHSFVYEVQCHGDHESESSRQIELSCSNNGRLALESSTCSSASVLLLASGVIMSQVSFCCYSTGHVTSKWPASSALCCWMRHAFGLIWILSWNIFVYYIRMWCAVKSVQILPWFVFCRPAWTAQILVPCSSPTSRCRMPARTCVSAATILVQIALLLKSRCTKVSCLTWSAKWETRFCCCILFSAWVPSNGFRDPISGNYVITNHNLIYFFFFAFSKPHSNTGTKNTLTLTLALSLET